MNRLRIGLMVAVLLAIATLVMIRLRPKPSPLPMHETWQHTLPDMDASGAGARFALLGTLHDFESSRESLAARCGAGAPEDPAEEYRAVIGDHWFVPNRAVWAIRIIPMPGSLDVTTRDANLEMPPRELSAGGREPYAVRTPRRAILGTAASEQLRKAWNDPDLWGPQTDINCMDGYQIELQACIAGRYAVRSHSCDPKGIEAGMRLWKTIRAVIPAPPPLHWESR